MGLDQFAIPVFGLSAAFLSQSASLKVRRWSSVCGLLSEPAWFYTGWTNHQWGIVVLACFYTFAWGKGFITNWITPHATKR